MPTYKTFADIPHDETISYNGKEYKVWNLERFGKTLKVAEIALECAVLDLHSNFRDEEAKRVDEQIAYYVCDFDTMDDVYSNLV